MDGSTQLRQRQLARRFPGGVLSIPFHDWDELQGKQEQQEYMQRVGGWVEATQADCNNVHCPMPPPFTEGRGFQLSFAAAIEVDASARS